MQRFEVGQPVISRWCEADRGVIERLGTNGKLWIETPEGVLLVGHADDFRLADGEAVAHVVEA